MTDRQRENVRRLLHNWRGLPARELAVRLRGLRAADRMGLISTEDRPELLAIQAELDGTNRNGFAASVTIIRGAQL